MKPMTAEEKALQYETIMYALDVSEATKSLVRTYYQARDFVKWDVYLKDKCPDHARHETQSLQDLHFRIATMTKLDFKNSIEFIEEHFKSDVSELSAPQQADVVHTTMAMLRMRDILVDRNGAETLFDTKEWLAEEALENLKNNDPIL